MALRIVAPSFVTMMSVEPTDCKILFMPFGPNVLFTRSPRARAPTNDERRAFSARSCVAYDCVSGPALLHMHETYLLRKDRS